MAAWPSYAATGATKGSNAASPTAAPPTQAQAPHHAAQLVGPSLQILATTSRMPSSQQGQPSSGEGEGADPTLLGAAQSRACDGVLEELNR